MAIDWDMLTEEEKRIVLNGGIVDIDGQCYKIDKKAMECDVWLVKANGEKIKID